MQTETRSTVLVVDDEPRILDSIRALLEDDFEVESTTDAQDALKLLDKTPIAVVLADQRMPGLTGDQFLARARELSDATRILITGYADIDALIQAVNEGGIHTYVPKPWDPAKLLKTVVYAVDRFHDERRKREAEKVVVEQQEAIVKSEAAYREQSKLLRSILDSMGDGVLVTNRGGETLLFNPAAERMVGSPTLPFSPGQQSDVVYHADTVTPYATSDLPLVRAARGEVVDEAELYIKRSATYLSVNARPLPDDEGRPMGAVAVVHNITANKRAAEQLRHAKEEAERANHAKSDFLSRMSHELRTPLNAILGFAQLLEMEPLAAGQSNSLKQILIGGHHLLRLINEVLDIARIEAGRLSLSLEPIAVWEAIDEALDLVRPLAERSAIGLSRSESTEDQRLFIEADRQRLLQILLNLLSNAVKYNRPNGNVSVSYGANGTDGIKILVRDTGAGIPPDKMGLLFSPFERLGAEQTAIEGTGVGLALSKRLVEAMGGAIGASSQSGEGSVFWVEFPRVEVANARHPADSVSDTPPISPAGGPTCTVLYIEDNLSNITLMERILAVRPGIRVVTATHGGVGLDMARECRPDLILLDNHLPDMSGEDVLRELRSDPRTATIPVAIVSADATESRITRLLSAGAQRYFAKPLSVRELLEFTDSILQALAAATREPPAFD